MYLVWYHETEIWIKKKNNPNEFLEGKGSGKDESRGNRLWSPIEFSFLFLSRQNQWFSTFSDRSHVLIFGFCPCLFSPKYKKHAWLGLNLFNSLNLSIIMFNFGKNLKYFSQLLNIKNFQVPVKRLPSPDTGGCWEALF